MRVLGRRLVKRQSIPVYGGGRSTGAWDPKSVKWESTREQGRQGAGEASRTWWDTRGQSDLWGRGLAGKQALFSIISGTVINAPRCPRTQTLQDGVQLATDLHFAKKGSHPTRPGHHIPKALAVVELALGQVALDQMDVLLAGSAGTAERGALGPLRWVRGGIVLRHNAWGAQDGCHELLPSLRLLLSSCSLCTAHR